MATVIILSVLLQLTQSTGNSEGILWCESSTIDQYRCIWEKVAYNANQTYQIESKRWDDGTDIYPINSRHHPQGNRTIYNFDCDKGRGDFTRQIVSVYRRNSSGRPTRVSDKITFIPYKQAIPNAVTNLTLNVTELSITAMWQRPYDLQTSTRSLYYKVRYFNQDVDKTIKMNEQQYTINELSPYSKYSISLACRFKLYIYDDEAKWGKETITRITTTGSTTSPSQTGVSKWLYVSIISLVCGMVLIVVTIMFIIQIKRKCFLLDMKNSSEILSNMRKWKDLTYPPATTEKEQYTQLRHQQTTELPAVNSKDVNSTIYVPDTPTTNQKSYEHIPFLIRDEGKPIYFKYIPTVAKDKISDSYYQLDSYVKINCGDGDPPHDCVDVCDDTAIDAFDSNEEIKINVDTELKTSKSCEENEIKNGESIEYGYIPN